MSIIKNSKEGKCEIRKAVFIYMRVIVLLKFKQFSKTFLNFLKQRKSKNLISARLRLRSLHGPNPAKSCAICQGLLRLLQEVKGAQARTSVMV
jgi:hypothetical protein